MSKPPSIPEGKRRYSVTLTEETMNRLHAYLKEKRAPKNIVSAMLDDFLADMLKTIDDLEAQQKTKGKTPGLGDLLTILGERLTEGEKREDVSKEKRTAHPDK